jgi:hypothetical protein
MRCVNKCRQVRARCVLRHFSAAGHTITSVPISFLSPTAFNSFSPLGRSQKREIDVQIYSGLRESHVCALIKLVVRGISKWVSEYGKVHTREARLVFLQQRCARRGSVIEIEREMI